MLPFDIAMTIGVRASRSEGGGEDQKIRTQGIRTASQVVDMGLPVQ